MWLGILILALFSRDLCMAQIMAANVVEVFGSSRGEVSLGPFYITYWAVVSRYLQSMVSERVLGVVLCVWRVWVTAGPDV